MSAVPGKRGFDLMIATAALIALSPMLLAVAIAIRFDSDGPILFRQQRIGRHGRPFIVFKFRSMRTEPVDRSRQITVGDDPRITQVGALLRRTKIDELPQLLNVLVGDMSMVGYRPDVPRYVCVDEPVQRQVLQRRPGLTDPASLRYHRESELLALAVDPDRVYRGRVLPDKLRISSRFARSETLSADWRVLCRSLRMERTS